MRTVTFDHLRGLAVLGRFHELTRNLFGVSVCMLAPDGTTSLCLGGQAEPAPFCRALQESFGRERCQQCDRRHLARAMARRQPLRYRCFAGLTEFLIPLALDGQNVAFLQCGQVLDAPPSGPSWQLTRRRLLAAGVEPASLRESYLRTSVVPRQAQADLIALLELIGDYVVHTQRELLLTQGTRSSQIVARAGSYLRRHLAERVTLAQVAAAAFTSPRNLCRVFRAETGQTVLAALNAQRIALACQRLHQTTDSCAEIAATCGFGSVQQFNRVFRQLERVTPSQWRGGGGVRQPGAVPG